MHRMYKELPKKNLFEQTKLSISVGNLLRRFQLVAFVQKFLQIEEISRFTSRFITVKNNLVAKFAKRSSVPIQVYEFTGNFTLKRHSSAVRNVTRNLS